MPRKTRKIGGKKIGQGAFGRVFSPPLTCKSGTKTYGDGFVSKILDERFIEEEYANSNLVREMDPEGLWSVTAEHVCELADAQENANYVKDTETHQIIYRHGGVSLFDLLLKPGVYGKTHLFVNGERERDVEDHSVYDLLDPDGLSRLIHATKGIIGGLDILNTKYLHGDIHLGNIVYDGHRSRLIDFPSLKRIEERVRIQRKAFTECIQINKKKEICSYVGSVIDAAVEDIAASGDVRDLLDDLQKLLRSEWVTQTFPGRFDAWLEKHKRCRFRSDYVYAILDCPA